jgi:hypothetical protein
VAALHTEDAVLMPPNTEAVKGRPAIEKLFMAFVAAGIKGVTLTSQEVEAHGDTATELGAYSIKDATGKEIDRAKHRPLEACHGRGSCTATSGTATYGCLRRSKSAAAPAVGGRDRHQA